MTIKTILILAANPLKTEHLRLDKEVEEIRTTLERSPNRDHFEIESRGAVRPQDLQTHLYNLKPQILHFSGHGGGEWGLAFEDEDGGVKGVSTESLADLFKLFTKEIQCVVLNACYAVVQAEAICQHIPYVIGMNQKIGDQAARKFAEGFYRAIWDNRSIEDAFASGVSAIALDGIPEELTPVLLKKDNPKMDKNAISDVSNMENILPQFSKTTQSLATIVLSDIVNFSRHIGSDDLYKLQLVERDLFLIAQLCKNHGGEVLKTTGDGLLMYFTSAVKAVACAIEIQNNFAQSLSKLPTEEVLQHRIGIHLGDVFYASNDVIGNTVNIAARLQSQADIGGICISETVYNSVKNQLNFDVKYIGNLDLKNIAESISAYQILIAGLTSQAKEISSKTDSQTTQEKQAKSGDKKESEDEKAITNQQNTVGDNNIQVGNIQNVTGNITFNR
ncbi:adenylate/guanylate cyclase domain-containing protein [Pseudanabaena sp. ABRG5-3]|uniref:adenylate/guanylate cyclase domain-containing protein n=1 Tax=Pseudanabaena sp. ABRG5-3 TaxID=685565 RepID=UPI000DC6EF88|nr:adenylate/guanylate cyclase domain-containing protein [Pseudanabaena sp. ABRG5-3]BBC22288.1 adenylate/guanylate cyclase [Pseudanabaena sp. ABRG5-3]